MDSKFRSKELFAIRSLLSFRFDRDPRFGKRPKANFDPHQGLAADVDFDTFDTVAAAAVEDDMTDYSLLQPAVDQPIVDTPSSNGKFDRKIEN